MLSTDTLSVYLNDHHAGSTGALDLIDKARKQNDGTEFGRLMDQLHDDIEADQQVLKDLMDKLEIEENPVKMAGAWIAEKVSRLKFDEKLTGSGDLSRLLEAEALSLGIEGKVSLWRLMREITDADSRLAGMDWDELIARGESQRERLEPFRLQAGAAAFTGAD